MLDFIYDSLDTVKKLKFPTVKQTMRLTAAIFALVIIAGAYFVLTDTLFYGGYKALYATLTDGKTPSSSVTPSVTTGTETLPLPSAIQNAPSGEADDATANAPISLESPVVETEELPQ